MAQETNPFGKSGTIFRVKVTFDMERSFGRHGKGIGYLAELSFDPAVFEPGSGKKLEAGSFGLKMVGFDDEDLEQLAAIGVSVGRWEKTAIEGLSGFGAMDAWLEEAASDAQASWLEESGYMDDLIDMEADFDSHFDEAKLLRVHA